MVRKRYKPEEIVSKLRQVDILHSQSCVLDTGHERQVTMHIPPPIDFRPDDGEPYEPDNAVWRLALTHPLVSMVLFLALAPTTIRPKLTETKRNNKRLAKTSMEGA